MYFRSSAEQEEIYRIVDTYLNGNINDLQEWLKNSTTYKCFLVAKVLESKHGDDDAISIILNLLG